MSEAEAREKIKTIAQDLYPWAKEEVARAETFGGFEAKDIWMRGIRNGLDHFAYAVSFYYSGDYQNSMTRLDDAKRQFLLAAHEAWTRCASLLCRKLDDILSSPAKSGAVDLAYVKLKSATHPFS
ncbi:MAG: hypothetical protein QW193_01200 [Nitrososphaerales archaeon]